MPTILAIPHGKGLWKIPEALSFLSTPHSGSDIANWMQYIKGIIGTSVSVDELQANDPRLRELNTVYRNHSQLKEIPIIVYCENEKTSGVMVVGQSSADPGIPGVVPIPLDENHISIAKPQSNKSQLYLRVKKFIRENLSNPQPLPTLQHSQDRIPQPDSQREANLNQGNYNENIQGNYIHVEGDYIQESEDKKKV